MYPAIYTIFQGENRHQLHVILSYNLNLKRQNREMKKTISTLQESNFTIKDWYQELLRNKLNSNNNTKSVF